MTPERWRRIEELFEGALEVERERRPEWVAAACGADTDLASNVGRLLRHADRPDDFLETFDAGRLADSKTVDPEYVGPYRIVRIIGCGGMGTVYLASRADLEYRKEVAVKLIRNGFDLDSVVRRFRRERQILASLEHPNIARLLDGGTTEDGLPYLVMEYVEGRPIHRYCEQHRLSIAARLRLFQMICAAVHFAHQNLIVHLDIKPGNILVTEAPGSPGTPKLLDFGIARLIDESGSKPRGDTTLVRPLTPGYASPEQIQGGPAAVPSDIYSLGMLLYELLSGDLPYRLSGLPPHEAARIVQEADPAPPSTAAALRQAGKAGARLRQQLAGDLDNIVLMALRKDPQRRYASAAQLSEDIDRYLRGLPVLARKDTLYYRSAKFVRRHKAAVGAAAAVFLALTAGLVSTAWQAGIAARQRAKAQAEQAIAEQRLGDILKLTHSLLFDYHDAVAGLNGSTAVRLRLVRDTLDYLDRLARESGGSVPVQREVAAAYLKIGDVQGRPYAANLGDTAVALASYRRAVDLLQPLSLRHPRDEQLRLGLSNAYEARGRLLTRTLDYTAAIADLRNAIAIRTTLAGAHPRDAEFRRQLAEAWIALGDPVLYTFQLPEALADYERAAGILDQLCAGAPADMGLQRQLASSRQRVGAVYDATGDILNNEFADPQDAAKAWRKALEHYRRAMDISERLARADAANAGFRRAAADSSADTARVLSSLGDLREALDLQTRAVAGFTALSRADAANQEARFDLLVAQRGLADILAKARRGQQALHYYRTSIATSLKLIGADPHNEELRNYLAGSYVAVRRLMAAMGDFAAARRYAKVRLKLDEDSAALFGQESVWRRYTTSDSLDISNLLDKSGEQAAARSQAATAFARAREMADRAGAPPADLAYYGKILLTFGSKDTRKAETAAAYLRRATESAAPDRVHTLWTLAVAYYRAGAATRAIETAMQAASALPYPHEAAAPATVRRDLERAAR